MAENQPASFHLYSVIDLRKNQTKFCDFRVFVHDVILVDFVKDAQNVKLACISLMGLECSNCGGVRLMDAPDARPLLAMVEGDDIDSQDDFGAIMHTEQICNLDGSLAMISPDSRSLKSL